MNRSAVGAIAAQGAQALASFVLQIAVARTLGISALGAFAILYGVVVLASGTVTGFVGDTLNVLDRRSRPIRSALQLFALVLAFGAGAVAAVVTTLLGFTSPVEAVAFAFAVAAFCLEEVVRRTLMADLRFWRVAGIDSVGLVVTIGIVGGVALTSHLTLGIFLGALAAGQTTALVVGVLVVPKTDRFLVPFTPGGKRDVAAYGVWRSLQQFLRPALLTAVRSAVGIVAGLAATGLLEAARVYVAPALLLVSGLSSYLFASFARRKDADVRERLRRADRAVLALLGLTAAVAVIAIVLLPFVGKTLFSAQPDLRAVAGWLAYTASVAAVTPYGALAAVSGGQAAVFAVRAADTTVSLLAVIIGLSLGMDPAWAAALLAVGSLGGGLVLRYRAARAVRPTRGRTRRVALVVGVVVVVVGGGIGAAVAVGRHPQPTPRATAAATSVITVIGDESGVGPGSDGRHWTARLPADVRVQLLGGGSDGWTDAGGDTAFSSLVPRIDTAASTVVVIGGEHDRTVGSLELLRAVSSTITEIEARLPTARVVVVGPLSPERPLPAALRRVGSVLRASAEEERVTFADPTSWFADGEGFAADGTGLDAVGEARMAAGLAPYVHR